MNNKQLKEKFPELFDVAKKIDPTDTGKYLPWIVTQLNNGHTIEDIGPTIEFFNSNTHKFTIKDIQQYDLKSLEDKVKEVENIQSRKEAKEGGATTIYKDDDVKIVRIEDKRGMLFYGSGTRWCVAGKDSNYFESYTANGNLFYIVLLKDKKLAIAIGSDITVWNENDSRLTITSEIRKYLSIIISEPEYKTTLLKIVYHNEQASIPDDELIDWFKKQPVTTQAYVQKFVSARIKFITHSRFQCYAEYSIDDLKKITENWSPKQMLTAIENINNKSEKLDEIMMFWLGKRKYQYAGLVAAITRKLTNRELILTHHDVNIRRAALECASKDELSKLLSHKKHNIRLSAFKQCVKKATPKELTKLYRKDNVDIFRKPCK
jgi:hypothetical protein